MRLYFIRHATASDKAWTDADRELTKEGKQEARIVGKALAKLGAKPSHLFSSPLVRAMQTAQMIARVMEFPNELGVLDELKNGSSTAELIRKLRPFLKDGDIFMIGHAPSMPQHIAALIGAKRRHGLDLGKGSVACVELSAARADYGQLRWLMRQKQLRWIVS